MERVENDAEAVAPVGAEVLLQVVDDDAARFAVFGEHTEIDGIIVVDDPHFRVERGGCALARIVLDEVTRHWSRLPCDFVEHPVELDGPGRPDGNQIPRPTRRCVIDRRGAILLGRSLRSGWRLLGRREATGCDGQAGGDPRGPVSVEPEVEHRQILGLPTSVSQAGCATIAPGGPVGFSPVAYRRFGSSHPAATRWGPSSGSSCRSPCRLELPGTR